MTIPKSAGLSHLADVCNEQALTFHYPVKKKGEPRRLRPNLDAIRYLEIESESDTEIVEKEDVGQSIFDDDGNFLGYEFQILRARGYFDAKAQGMYPWPMFQVFRIDAIKVRMVGYLDPCPDCDDWSRTSRCAEHHDRDGVAGLRMGNQRGQERVRRRNAADGRQVVNAYASPDRATAMAEYFRAVVDNSEARYTPAQDGRQYFTQTEQDSERERQRAAQARLYALTPCTCSMCQPRPRVTDPNEGRPGYVYSLASDQWVREDRDGFRIPDRLLRIDSVPDELTTADMARIREAMRSLPSGSIEISNATIEVNGETLQGVQSFTIHIQGDADGT